ncbi:MAG: RibD family protein [Wenzhouxiangella sp.]
MSQAWTLLRQAAEQDWQQRQAWTGMLNGEPVQIGPGGSWYGPALLDKETAGWLDRLLEVATWPGPLVLAQLGQTLDGRIATVSGDSFYVNGLAARTHLHALRALVDAVVIGVGTAVADQPRLTVRHVDGPSPVRVIIDPNDRLPRTGPLVEPAASDPPVIQLVASDADLKPLPASVERLLIDRDHGGFEPAAIVRLLAERGLSRLLIEGGAHTVSRFLAAGALHRLHLLVAPLLLGSGRPGIDLPAIERLAEARRLPMRSVALDDELLVSVALD